MINSIHYQRINGFYISSRNFPNEVTWLSLNLIIILDCSEYTTLEIPAIHEIPATQEMPAILEIPATLEVPATLEISATLEIPAILKIPACNFLKHQFVIDYCLQDFFIPSD